MKFSDAKEKVSVFTNSPNSQKLSIAKYHPLKVAKFKLSRMFPTIKFSSWLKSNKLPVVKHLATLVRLTLWRDLTGQVNVKTLLLVLVEASGGWLVTEKVIVSLFLSVAVSFTTTVLPTVASITDEAFTNCGGKFSVEKIRNLAMVHITSPQRNRVLDEQT